MTSTGCQRKFNLWAFAGAFYLFTVEIWSGIVCVIKKIRINIKTWIVCYQIVTFSNQNWCNKFLWFEDLQNVKYLYSI